MACDGSLARKREDVSPYCAWRRHRRLVLVFCRPSPESARMDQLYPLVVIHESGLDGFWLGRVLSKQAGIESHIVEAASIAMPRRHRRAKTDRIDGETLIRALMAWKRGEPRACSMVKLLTPEEEDNRRLFPACCATRCRRSSTRSIVTRSLTSHCRPRISSATRPAPPSDCSPRRGNDRAWLRWGISQKLHATAGQIHLPGSRNGGQSQRSCLLGRQAQRHSGRHRQLPFDGGEDGR